MASGEMDREAYKGFQKAWLAPLFQVLAPGGYVQSCIDWRSVADHVLCGEAAGFTLANIVVWSKPNPGQGSLWRSAHEFIVVFRKPGAKSINNIRLGSAGRSRSNVWTYPGGASLHSEAREALADHPTPKSLAMVADAILDVTHRGDLTADTFLGSGTTLLAAQQTGRRFRGIEIDPRYVDLSIRRWEAATGSSAVHASTGETFATVMARRDQASGGGHPGEPDSTDVTTSWRPPDGPINGAGPPASADVLALPKPRRRVPAPSRRED